MDEVKGGTSYGAPRGGLPAVASNSRDPDHKAQPAGWDPFEVWRTRVRDVQQARAREGDAPGKR